MANYSFELPWFQQFFYKEAGLQAAQDLKTAYKNNNGEELFQKYFLNPVESLFQTLRGAKGENKDQPLTDVDIKEFVVTYGSFKMYAPFRTLPFLLSTFMTDVITEQSTLKDALEKSIDKLQTKLVTVAMLCKGGRPFIAYADNESIPYFAHVQDTAVLGLMSHFRNRLPNLKELSQSNPTTITDYQITALRHAVQSEMLKEENLSNVIYEVPDYDKGAILKVPVNAMDERLPGYYVRRLINQLAPAFVSDYETSYHAALAYAKEHPEEYRSTIPVLEKILDKIEKKQYQMANTSVVEDRSKGVDISGLNDDNVTEYLHVTYGIPYDGIANLLRPTAKTLYTTSELLDDADTMSAKEFIDQVNEGQAPMGTLDEIVEAYCKHNNVSLDCTIAQLIHHINYEGDVMPKSLQDTVKEYLEKDNPGAKYTTLEEFANGIEHVIRDDVDIADSVISNCECIDTDTKTALHKAIFKGVPFAAPSLINTLVNMQLPAALVDAMVDAEKTGKSFVMPDLEVSDDKLITELTRRGFVRSVANTIVTEKKLPEVEVTDDMIVSELEKKGITGEDAKKIVSGIPIGKVTDLPTEELMQTLVARKVLPEPVPVADEIGYKVAEKLLVQARELLLENDTYENRLDMIPICYAFVRMFMLKANDAEEIPDILNQKKSECKGVGIKMIDEALKVLG